MLVLQLVYMYLLELSTDTVLFVLPISIKFMTDYVIETDMIYEQFQYHQSWTAGNDTAFD